MTEQMETEHLQLFGFYKYMYDPAKSRQLCEQGMEELSSRYDYSPRTPFIQYFHKAILVDKWEQEQQRIEKKSKTSLSAIPNLLDKYGGIFKTPALTNPIPTQYIKVVYFHVNALISPIVCYGMDQANCHRKFMVELEKQKDILIDNGICCDDLENFVWCLWDDLYSILTN